MNRHLQLLLAAICIGFVATTAYAKEPSTLATPPLGGETPRLEDLRNQASVTVKSAATQKELKAGDPLNFGDRVVTGDGTAIIRYPDGSQLLVAPRSELTLETPTTSAQWSRLHKGTVRGIITKSQSIPLERPKFVIRSRAAILGVRGTDFVMGVEAASGNVQVHTLQGSVEVAKNEVALLSGKGTVVGDGQFIETGRSAISSNISSEISAPQSFSKDAFIKSLNQGGLQAPAGSGGVTVSSAAGAGGGGATQLATGASASGGASAGASGGLGSPGTFGEFSHAGTGSFLQSSPGLSAPEPGGLSAQPPTQTPTTPESPEPPQKAQNEGGPKLLAFQAGFFFTVLDDSAVIRALSAHWVPSIPFPMLSFLSLRASLGGHFAQQASLANAFVVVEAQAFLTFVPMDLIFVEAGIGHQSWRAVRSYENTLGSVRAGLRVKMGLIDQIFAGADLLDLNPRLSQYRVGIGISF